MAMRNIKDVLVPLTLLLAVVGLRLKNYLMKVSGSSIFSSSSNLILRVTSVFSRYAISSIVIVLGFIIILLVLYRLKLLFSLKSGVNVGDLWIEFKDKFIGCIVLSGELIVDNSQDLVMLEDRVERLFQALRNSSVNYTLFISSSIDNEYKAVLGMLVVSDTEDEIKSDLYKVKSSIEATLPELDVRILNGRSLLDLLNRSLVPINCNKLTKVRSNHDPLSSLMISYLKGAKRASYKGIALWHLPLGHNPSREDFAIYLGNVIADNREIYAFNLSLQDFSSHIAIFGTTGSGKTTTAKTIALRLLKKGIGVLILDWHNEYSDLLSFAKGTIYRLGVDNISINPLAPSKGYSLSEHIEFVTDLFSDVFNLSHPQAFMFREALKKAYLKARLHSREPTILDLVEEIEKMPIRSGWDHETKTALLRRLKLLTEGRIGRALNGQNVIKVEDLLRPCLVIIELGHIRNVYAKQLLVFSILKMIYDHYVGRGHIVNRIKHLTIVEEAFSALSQKVGGYQMVERMLSELRKYGESLVIISQSPSSIPSGVIKNTAMKIIHTLHDGRDVDVILSSIGLDKAYRKIFHILNVGDAIIRTPSLNEPLIVRIKPEVNEKVHKTSDELIIVDHS
ncbi:MAG: ATP-binding protein [Thermoprotei archaeon]|nr:ATP-binding protein [Thermoprotei archaeon]